MILITKNEGNKLPSLTSNIRGKLMSSRNYLYAGFALTIGLLSRNSFASEEKHKSKDHEAVAGGPACTGFGPQAPRDIDNVTG